MFRQEFRETLNNTIWQNDRGEYEVFDKYRIVPEKSAFRVWCWDNDIGLFNTTRSALSWCIADKYCDYNLANNLLSIDSALGNLSNDIYTRAHLADRSRNPDFRESVGCKLETKIIQKKQLENELTKCVSLAKYLQQRGFDNETARTGRGQPNKTSR
jgi:hypothetical protein